MQLPLLICSGSASLWLQVLASAYPFIIARLLNDPSPDTRRLLLRLLLQPNGAVRWQRVRRLVRRGLSGSWCDSGSCVAVDYIEVMCSAGLF